MRILGVDPGIASWALADRSRPRQNAAIELRRDHHAAGLPLARRLVQIEQDTEALIAQLKPDAIAVEELFFSNNITTGIAVAHGRGIITVYRGKERRAALRIHTHAGQAGRRRLWPC